MRFCSLASGSTGNCYYIGGDCGSVLVDAGISARAIEQALIHNMQVDPRQLSGILVTHEHVDHIKGVGTLARRYHLPIYASLGTWRGMTNKIGDIAADLIKVLPEADHFNLAGLDVEWFATNHDAAEPVSYVIHEGVKKIGIVTDTGVINAQAIGKLYNNDVIVIEANHDEGMLRNGRYPRYLQARILSNQGHLSNKDCGVNLQEMIGSKTNHVVLAHLSQENNLPNLAHQTVKDILLGGQLSGKLKLWVAKAKEQSVTLDI